jgi:hypothetical protein
MLAVWFDAGQWFGVANPSGRHDRCAKPRAVGGVTSWTIPPRLPGNRK